MKNKIRTYIRLFASTFYLSAFTFGGGYVIVTLMKRKFVDDLKWLEENEMLNLTAIAQSSPGAIAVNASIMLGYRIAGLAGALISALGTILPPLIIISIISAFYTEFKDNVLVSTLLKGMQAGVAAVIVDVVVSMGEGIIKSRSASSITIMIASFLATCVFKINAAFVILAAGLLGVLFTYQTEKSGKEVINQ